MQTNLKKKLKRRELMNEGNASVIEWEKAYNSNSLHHKNKYPYPEIISFVLRNFGEAKNKKAIRILDLGCGWGNNLIFLKENDFDYYGVDFSETAVNHCKKSFENISQCDFSKLPYENDFFNCILDRMAIQHNPRENIKRTFNEVFRVLKSNGLFFSVLMVKKDCDFFTICLTKEEIKRFLISFVDVKIITLVSYDENNVNLSKIRFLTAKKE